MSDRPISSPKKILISNPTPIALNTRPHFLSLHPPKLYSSDPTDWHLSGSASPTPFLAFPEIARPLPMATLLPLPVSFIHHQTKNTK